ncbi:MAG: DUF4124 domain-containing protein [Hydrogenophaga sp.]|uniref:DUF4124 domain-containing protein n=1 Tax=Hydrogenophaga sp. TaxID=1904254 RepID=UPI002579ED1C|nr:DUF4124 domain-containing protein [Hydrogenophaga sp.]MBL0946471.1 DUF4124 domain-containing protein [Hydrogenophaga sp.]
MRKPHRPHRLLAQASLALVTALALPAALAQWQWIDSTGRKVFSDTAPPAGTPDKNILKRPGQTSPMAPVAPAAPAEPTAASPAAPAAPKLPARDSELEARKKQAEAAEEAKRKAEAERVARARADNCNRATQARNTLDSGMRVAITNAKGEREFMDDKTRASERQRIEQIIRSECGPAPAAQ